MIDQEAGYVEYGVRCPDGVVRWSSDDERLGVERSRELFDLGHPTHPGRCAGPHEVIQRTVGPWEKTR